MVSGALKPHHHDTVGIASVGAFSIQTVVGTLNQIFELTVQYWQFRYVV
jgi:hypothetical protein